MSDPVWDSNPELRALWEIEQQKYRETKSLAGNGAAGVGSNGAAGFGSTNFGAQPIVTLGDFYAYMPMHNYIFTPTRDMWVAGSVNARIPPVPLVDAHGVPLLDKGKQKTISATLWLDQNKPVEQLTWAPGLPMIIANRLISEGEWINRNGVSCFNLYRPPNINLGDPNKAGRWIDLVYMVFPNDADHIIKWLAQRRQKPEIKINHALVLAGSPGIGKDTMLEPVKHAVGPWNFQDISPVQMLGRFNGFVKSVILRISEARDLGEFDRFKFYEHMKPYEATPPDMLRVDEKNLREYSILNCTSIIITTNYKASGIYLPADDRRHYVAWSDRKAEDFTKQYWEDLWDWYENGDGFNHVVAYLHSLNLSGFSAKAPPTKTPAFWEIVDASRVPEDAEMADVLDELAAWNTGTGKKERPEIVTILELASKAAVTGRTTFHAWLTDRKNSKLIPHRFEECGYVAVRNDSAKDGLWKVEGKRQVIYAKAELRPSERFAKAAAWVATKR